MLWAHKTFEGAGGNETNVARDALNAHLVIRLHGVGRSTSTWVHCTPRMEDKRLTDVTEKEQEGAEY